MKNNSILFNEISELRENLSLITEKSNTQSYESILVQVFTSSNKQTWLRTIFEEINNWNRDACVVGLSSVGEIKNGKTHRRSNLVTISFFDSTQLEVVDCIGQECEVREFAKNLSCKINEAKHMKGVLLFSTPYGIDIASFNKHLSYSNANISIFGGIAGSYDADDNTLLMYGDRCSKKGIMAVLLSGEYTSISTKQYLGWNTIGKEMTVTKVRPGAIVEIDNEPAYDVYKRYLNIEKGNNFHLNTVSFTLIVKRGNKMLSRVPLSVADDHSMVVVAEVNKGDIIQIGYGEVTKMLRESEETLRMISATDPEGIFIYACSSRHTLMGGVLSDEFAMYELVAPTNGFYGYGEFYCLDGEFEHLNSAVVVVGISERKDQHRASDKLLALNQSSDYQNYRDYNGIRRLSELIHSTSSNKYEVSLKLFGDFEAKVTENQRDITNWRTEKSKELFILLVSSQGMSLGRDVIIEKLWPDMELEKATKLYYTTVYYMKKTLEEYGVQHIVQKNGGRHFVDFSKVRCDLNDYLVSIQRSNLESLPINNLIDIDNLYRGELMGRRPYPWLEDKSTWLEDKNIVLKEMIAARYKEMGDHIGAKEYLKAILKCDNYNENAYKGLMMIAMSEGNNVEALAYYKRYEKVLQNELGILPSVEIRKMILE